MFVPRRKVSRAWSGANAFLPGLGGDGESRAPLCSPVRCCLRLPNDTPPIAPWPPTVVVRFSCIGTVGWVPLSETKIMNDVPLRTFSPLYLTRLVPGPMRLDLADRHGVLKMEDFAVEAPTAISRRPRRQRKFHANQEAREKELRRMLYHTHRTIQLAINAIRRQAIFPG